MRARITLLLFAILYSFTCLAQTNFEKHFTKKSLRIDFALSGNWDFQAAAIQQLREEPVWAGPVKNLIDPCRELQFSLPSCARGADMIE